MNKMDIRAFAPEETVAQTTQARPIVWWALVGAAFWVLQIYVIGSWLMSGKLAPTPPGPDPMPLRTSIAILVVQVVFGISVVWGFLHIAYTLIKKREFSAFNLIQIGWVAMTWQDLIIGYVRPQFVFNSHMVNVGSWGSFIPGWISPNDHLMPEPLAMQPSMYVALVPAMVMFGVGVMRWVKGKWPSLNGVQLTLVCAAAVILNDLVNEAVLCYLGVFAYVGVIRAWSIFPGTPEQFPLYEAIIYGVVITFSAAAFYFTDKEGRMFFERGADRVSSGCAREIARGLAVSGYVNITLLIYAILLIWVSFYIDERPKLPSYLDNGICGGTSGYPCPAPGVPIQTQTRK
ncbi:hypothetical protein OKW43_004318 [Paraburkholderia sp. WC7.3g]|uniref:Spirocyclase, AveC family n=1 Tax=Paraburkholderia podalyriae TaxID=1938811 RepID=A0ABR7Q1N2_9BURK|nr:spirocyclase AveC family protein [Paraburkholderia podalyriae]MBC8752460.1 spirocyclase, AveC family [Paraburkholderia podalyriae]